jgi:hypothetical protein
LRAHSGYSHRVCRWRYLSKTLKLFAIWAGDMAILITSTTGETYRLRAANSSLSHLGRYRFDSASGMPEHRRQSSPGVRRNSSLIPSALPALPRWAGVCRPKPSPSHPSPHTYFFLFTRLPKTRPPTALQQFQLHKRFGFVFVPVVGSQTPNVLGQTELSEVNSVVFRLSLVLDFVGRALSETLQSRGHFASRRGRSS